MNYKEAVDVVIVGAGASGSLLAAKLSEGRKKVVVLEAGPAWHLRDLFSSQIWARRLKWGSAPTLTGGSAPIGIGFNTGGGFGGSALHHYANWYRLHPGDFKEQSLFGENLDWPITYEDLQPFYDQIQTEIGISGDTKAETTRPAAAPYPMPPLKSFKQGSLLVKGAEALGIQNFPTPHAINSIEYKGRNACLLDGWCDAGCPIGALANPLVVSIPAARAAGAEFRSYSNVTKVLTGGNSQSVTGVVYRDQAGSEHFQPASVVILAAFAIQTPRLLLNSASSRFPAGLANSSGTVGQYITMHTTTPVYALFNEDTEPYSGVTGGSFTSQGEYDNKKKNGYFGSYTLAGASALKPNDLIGIANTRSDLFGSALHTFMKQAAHHINNMLPVGETNPLPQNRVTLSSQADAFGVPLAQVTHELSNNDLQLSADAATQSVRIFNSAGATQVWQGQISGQHIMGGAIMGSDPESSVTNSYGQTHDLPNLFIAGTSLFPTTGAVNPTFTVHALALRTAGYLLSNWGAIAGKG
jgi:choline dehydrogenase-like flavoprotein